MKRSDEVLRLVHQWIENGTLAHGQKAPSVRQMSRITGYSMSTVHNAYGMLESAGVFVAHPRSGFFVGRALEAPASLLVGDDGEDSHSVREISISELTLRLFASWGTSEIQQFGAIYASSDLFPVAEINRHFRRILRTTPRGNADDGSSPAQGDLSLRETLTRRYMDHGIALKPKDIVLTAGGMHGLNLCINVLTKPGDIVLVEAPSMFPIFTALEHRGLRAVEIPYHSKTGLDPDRFRYLVDRHDVRACVLMPVHHYPTGVTTPDSAIRRIVRIAQEKNLPIIENGGYMDLHYAGGNPPTLKKYDEAGLVLQIGSFSNTLTPGYGVGWLVPGRFREKIVQMKFAGNLISGGIFQCAIGDYMQSGGFERQLRHLRERLKDRMATGLDLIAAHFPAGCRVTNPLGGFMCWVEGPPGFDAVAACREALALGVGLPPGPLFSVREQFPNCLGLNFSFPWIEDARSRLAIIGALIRKHS
jgi:DNA-binding transcriptional MocR family regulator